MSNGLIGHQPQPLPHHRHANSKNEPSWQRRPLPKIVPPWKATDDVLGSMDSVCALFYVFYWVFPRAKSKHTKSKRRGRKDSFLSFDEANKFVQLLTTLSTTKHGNHSGEILALRGGSLGRACARVCVCRVQHAWVQRMNAMCTRLSVLHSGA